MRTQDRLGFALLATMGAAGLGGLWWMLPPESTTATGALTVLLFAVAAGIAELRPMRHRRGEPVPAAVAVIGAAATLGMSPVAVASIAGLSWVTARLIDRDLRQPLGLPSRILAGWALSGISALGAAVMPGRFVGHVSNGLLAAELSLGSAALVAFSIIVAIPAVGAIADLEGRWRYAGRRMREAIAATWLISLAVASTAILGALVHPVLRHWTLPTMLIPLLAARIGLDRYAVASRAYDQTIRAMSRLPEQLDSVDRDHGVRVAQLAHDVGLELGLDAGTLADLEHAAHLHELGRVAIERDDTPVDGRRDLARAGASVIAEATSSLDRVARIVAAHGEPAQPHDDDVRVPARIVAACCEVDRYAPNPAQAGQRDELLVRLVREIGDLEVVAALARALDGRRVPS
ncbi:hypothetical protein [Egicoccus sp. AB-alg2]|uniref:hypothetical protein n=1 Tax=Egicoccus sp. AB-alg2 TaxID=3242693 RepID=UPI00359D8FB1